MTISTTANTVTYSGNSSTTVFVFSFPIPVAGDLIVTTTTGATTTLVSSSLYTVTGIGNSAGGSITYNPSGVPLPTGSTITLTRTLPLVQASSLINQGGFYPATLEAALDYLTMVDQQILALVSASAPTTFVTTPISANTILGNNTGATAAPIAMSAAQTKTLLAIAESDVANLVTDLATITANVAEIETDLGELLPLAGGTLTGDVVLADVAPTDPLSAGFRGTPVVTVNAIRTFGLTDSGKCMQHDETTARTWTIPANASVAFKVGSIIVLDNTGNSGGAPGAITLVITTDTLRRGDGTAGTGSRTIPANGVAVITKTKTAEWRITGTFT